MESPSPLSGWATLEQAILTLGASFPLPVKRVPGEAQGLVGVSTLCRREGRVLQFPFLPQALPPLPLLPLERLGKVNAL